MSPTEIFLKLQANCDYAFLLESIEGPRKLARFSFIGLDPRLVLTVRKGEATVENRESEAKTHKRVVDPLEFVKSFVSGRAGNNDLCFDGGAVGYFSYDAVQYWEELPNGGVDDLKFPDVEMGIYDDGLVFDHARRDAFYFYRHKDRSEDLTRLVKLPCKCGELSFTTPKVNMSRGYYDHIVEKAKEQLFSGDIFQVVLSKRYDFQAHGDLSRFYTALRAMNPSPYMYFLKMKDRNIIGSSPEMLVKVEKNTVTTFPIAGTRPVVDDPEKTRAYAKELLMDPKERAEHIMLVDLARNDVGKVARFGTVRVSKFMQVYKYSHVQHIVSKVSARLKPDCDSFDALKAVFPAGTVSGAPKVRAMEIIRDSEPTRRGPYAGAVGYFSYNGNADFAITIRTLVSVGNKCSIQAGSGIVADSIPENEWLETEHKAKALMEAIERSEG